MTSLRLLFHSNLFHVKTGYGVQAASILPRLAALPEFGGRHAVAQSAYYGLEGAVIEIDGFRVYPKGVQAYGNDIIGGHTAHFGANVVITLIDVWVLEHIAASVKPALWLPWTPIDCDPVPERVLESLDGAYLPLVFSKWGHDLLEAAGVRNRYMAMGVEPTVYHVEPDKDKVRQFKREKLRNARHLTVMVAANKGWPDRKAFQVQIRAWAEFAKDKPGAMLYLHTDPTGIHGGPDLAALCRSLGLQDKVMFPNHYANWIGIQEPNMAMMYNCADVLMGASMSEGFGIPIIEAQACGVPVVVTDFSAMPELVRWGKVVAPADKFWSQLNSWQVWPDVHGIRDALEELYAEWHESGDFWMDVDRLAVQDAIHEEYSWDVLVEEQWKPLIRRVLEDAPPLPSQFRTVALSSSGWKAPISQPESNGLHKLGVTKVEAQA